MMKMFSGRKFLAAGVHLAVQSAQMRMMKDHIFAQGERIGTYER